MGTSLTTMRTVQSKEDEGRLTYEGIVLKMQSSFSHQQQCFLHVYSVCSCPSLHYLQSYLTHSMEGNNGVE